MTWRSLGRVAAVIVCAAAGALLAIAQTYVVHDRVAAVHPAWPWPVQWSMATGFELAIISVGLACVVTGFDRYLVASEAGLLIPSLAVAVDVVSPGLLPSWVSVAAISVMPAQYLVVILAGHRLHTHYDQPDPEPAIVEEVATVKPATRRPRKAATEAVTVPATATRERPPSARTLRRWRQMARDSGMVVAAQSGMEAGA